MTSPNCRSYQLPPPVEAFRQRVIAFCDACVRPRADQIDLTGAYPDDLHGSLVENGFLRAIVPDDCGGLGLGHLGRAVLIEEIARVSAAVSMIPQVNELGCTPLAIAGTPEQCRRWVAPVARGELFASYGLTEPTAGSDVAALQTLAERDGRDWVISGEKAWICNVRQPNGFCVIFARTAPSGGHKGLTAFVVPTGSPGFKILGAEPTMGLRGSPTYNLELDHVRVSDSDRIGEVGGGFRLAMRTLDQTRAAVAAQALGIARAAFDAALDYAVRRRAFGVPLIEHQAVGFEIADMDMKIRAARHLAYEANTALDAGDPEASHISSVAKCFVSDVAMQVTLAAVDVLGGNGYSRRYPVERFMRDAKVTQIFEGTNSIQRLIISRTLRRAAVGRLRTAETGTLEAAK